MIFEYSQTFQNWFEIYRSAGCCLLSLLGAYTLYMTVGKNRCINGDTSEDPILPLVNLGHYFAACFFIMDELILLTVKKMWRMDLFIHHCVCLFLLAYFTVDFPLMGSIFYVGEALTILNFLRQDYPLGVTAWRLFVILCIRFPVFGLMFMNVSWKLPECSERTKAAELAAAICFFLLYDLYVLNGCVQALFRHMKEKKI